MSRIGRSAYRLGRIPWRRSLGWPVLLAALIGGFVAALLGNLCGYLLGGRFLQENPAMFVAIGAIGQSLFASVFLLAVLHQCPPRGKLTAKLGIRPLRGGDYLAVGIGLAGILLFGNILTALWQVLLDGLGIPYQEEQDLIRIVAQADPVALCFLAVGTIIGAPLSEEIFFRRVLYGLLRPLGAGSALVMTSLIFSLIHFFLLGIPALFLMGLAFQVVYLIRRNLLCAMLMHGVVNLVACIGALLLPEASLFF